MLGTIRLLFCPKYAYGAEIIGNNPFKPGYEIFFLYQFFSCFNTFRSGEEGIYPDLTHFAEEQLRKLSPKK